MDTIKVLVADGDAASREGICLMLDDDLHTVAAAQDSDQVLHLVATYRPQVVLLDVRLPDAGGLEVARRIKTRWPDVKIIILTVFDEYLDEALAAGADGYLLKGRPLAELRATIRRVAGTAHKHSNNVLDS